MNIRMQNIAIMDNKINLLEPDYGMLQGYLVRVYFYSKARLKSLVDIKKYLF